MVSNYDEKALRVEISEGKRHYHKQKKTSLFGSESPRKSTTHHNRYTKPDINTNHGEENIFTKNEVIKREMEDKKYKSAIEKRATLQELESYDPWGKPGAGAANINYGQDQSGNRAKWEYEQELKRMEDYKNSEEKSYPGFAPGFGCGNVKNSGRRRSDVTSNGDEVQQNIYYPFGSPGGGAPVTDDKKKSQGATVTVHRQNETVDNEPLKKLEEAKAYADHLEQEIQRLRLKQMDDKYASMKTNLNDSRSEKNDNNTNLDYEDDSLYREAENRARMRELERLKESYEQHDDRHENDIINDHRQREYNQEYEEASFSRSKEIPRVPVPVMEPKRAGSSSTHNDYRPYSKEEYMNSRQQLVNPTQLKRTTLSGSEELSRNERSRNVDGNHNFKHIDEENINKSSQGTANTYNNIFPSDRNFSASKPNSGQFPRKAPYATD